MTNVIGLYNDPGKARQVINELLRAGLQENDIELMDQQQDPQLEQHIAEFGISQDHAHLYAEAVRHGKAVLNARAPEDQAERILDILDSNGALNIDEAAKEFSQQQGQQTEVIPEIEEELSVGKRQTLQGGKRVTAKVTEKPVEESVRLKEEKVEVQRRDSDRKLSPQEAEQALKDQTREFTETREVPEVKKEARETGQVEIKKSATEREEKVKDTVRKTEVQTEEIKPEKPE
jgi:stress response protein YsnF